MKKAIVTAALTSILGLTSWTATAASIHTYEFAYPGVACNAFGNPAAGANGGSDIVNWGSASPMLVDCPFVRSPSHVVVANTVYVAVRGNVDCTVRSQERTGAGWIWYPSHTNWANGFAEMVFDGNMVLGDLFSSSVECRIPQGAAVNQYRVNTYFLEDPGN